MSISALYDRSPKVYMWTFTFPVRLHTWLTPGAWSALTRLLRDYYGRIEGVRVMEMHKTHGVHFHVLVDRRLSVHVVRRLAKRCGFGRVHVCRIKREDAGYVTKYVGKQTERPHGMKQWTAVSRGWATRKADIVVESSQARAMRAAYAQSVLCGEPKQKRYARMIEARNAAAVAVSQ